MSAMPESLRPVLPEGWGMFARWPRPKASTLDGYATAGISHVYFEVVRQAPASKPGARRIEGVDPMLVEAGRRNGLAIIPWAFVVPGTPSQWDELAPALISAAHDCDVDAVCLDVEGKDFRPAAVAAPLQRVIDELRAAGLRVIVTSWGVPTLAWAGWAPCLQADAVVWQLARVGAEAVRDLALVRAAYPHAEIGLCAEPTETKLAHRDLLAGLLEVSRTPSLELSGSIATWANDHYARHPEWLAELGALEFRGLS